MITACMATGVYKDFVVSSMRAQAKKIDVFLTNLEYSDAIDTTYVEESLRDIEQEIRLLRKVLA